MVEDNDGDYLLAAQAMQDAGIHGALRRVRDGEELLDYLAGRGSYAGPADRTEPALILLDLNMPRKDGREALAEIKADPVLRRIPVVVFTTSNAEEDVVRSYDLGVNSYVRKPVTFDDLVEVMGTIGRYWLDIVHPPAPGPHVSCRT